MKAVTQEIILMDSVRRAQERLSILSQKATVSSYINEFRNTVIFVPSISEDEKIEKFWSGLKPMVWLEVLESGPWNVENSAGTALNFESAFQSRKIEL